MATCNMRRQIEKIGYLRRDVAFGLIFAHKPSSTHTFQINIFDLPHLPISLPLAVCHQIKCLLNAYVAILFFGYFWSDLHMAPKRIIFHTLLLGYNSWIMKMLIRSIMN